MRNRVFRAGGLAFRLPLAALLIAVAGPVEAQAKQQSGDGTAIQKSGAAKSKSKSSAQECERRVVPPFMRNPRFMNRGFFKPKCPE
jgi:hypothetical protein